MSKYAQFEVFLKEYLYENLHKSHIESALSEGFKYIELDVFPNGSIRFIFRGNNSSLCSFNSLKEFYQRSGRLDELEGLGYALVSSCVDVEKSTKDGVPSKYRVVVNIQDAEVFNYKVGFAD